MGSTTSCTIPCTPTHVHVPLTQCTFLAFHLASAREDPASLTTHTSMHADNPLSPDRRGAVAAAKRCPAHAPRSLRHQPHQHRPCKDTGRPLKSWHVQSEHMEGLGSASRPHSIHSLHTFKTTNRHLPPYKG